MRFTAAISLAALLGLSAARNCSPGLQYCGYILQDIGNYNPQIDAELRADGMAVTDFNRKHSVFHCKGGSNGDIVRMATCSSAGCKNNGEGESDWCYETVTIPWPGSK